MNAKKNNLFSFLKSKFTFRVWLAIMLLVAVSIAFLWTIQIGLFERNYVNTTINEIENRIEPIAESVEEFGLEETVGYISMAVHGKVYLLDAAGDLVYVYSIGLPAAIDEMDQGNMHYFGANLDKVLAGERYEEIIQEESQDMKLAQGVPVSYNGESYALFVFTFMTEINATQVMNHNQLLFLSICLIVAAALLAFALAKHLVKPVKIIKKTVDRLTEGDLTAKPNLHRSDELGQLSDSVEQLGESLQRVDVLRKEVIANVSHELRAPLSVIVGYSELVRDITGPDEKRRNENMELIIKEAKRLSRMVDDIMDYSQFQSGYIVLNKKDSNLYEVVETEVQYAQEISKEYRILLLYKLGRSRRH